MFALLRVDRDVSIILSNRQYCCMNAILPPVEKERSFRGWSCVFVSLCRPGSPSGNTVTFEQSPNKELDLIDSMYVISHWHAPHSALLTLSIFVSISHHSSLFLTSLTSRPLKLLIFLFRQICFADFAYSHNLCLSLCVCITVCVKVCYQVVKILLKNHLYWIEHF